MKISKQYAIQVSQDYLDANQNMLSPDLREDVEPIDEYPRCGSADIEDIDEQFAVV